MNVFEFRILAACKYYTTFKALLFFNDMDWCFFSLCRRVCVFFQKSSSAYINKPTHADTVIKSCSAKWVFSQNPKIYTNKISLSKLIFNWNAVLQHATWLSQGKQNS